VNRTRLLCLVFMVAEALGCSGKHRPFASEPLDETDAIHDEAASANDGPGGPIASPSEACEGPSCAIRPEQLGPVDGLSGGDTDEAGAQAAASASGDEGVGSTCLDGATESCGPPAEEGVCKFGTRTCSAGVWGDCMGAIFGGTRDCSSSDDNDCDGQPDNTLDDSCRCPVMGTRPCDEHPGFDGRGACHSGLQSCVLGAGNATSDWGACSGSVGPEEVDSCVVAEDDANCDGTPNSDCECVEGQIQFCGPPTDNGICTRGMSVCVGGAFSSCQGAVFPGRRDCGSPQDNDCDGLPDNTIDATCSCVIGTVQACGAHPGRDGNGPCRAGQQLCVAGAQNATTNFGACTGSIGPAQRDSCTTFGDDADCNGTPNSGCQCVAGRGNQPCSSDPNNSRCNAQGVCAPCQTNADCSLVSGGRTLCNAGACSASRCGDGIVSTGEQCDDGNAIDTDDCTNACRFAACGDGFSQASSGEECDDRNTVSGDGCSNTCQIARTPHGTVSFGAYHMCTPLVSGRVMCWGSNAFGQLGTGDNFDSATPLPVLNLNSAVEVALSDIATCARLANNTVTCWGTNSGGNLGSTTAADSTSPVVVPNLNDAVQLVGGGSGFCAVRSGGRVGCWGDSSPTNGGVTDKLLAGITQIAGGNLHFCGVRADGTMACWGSNLAGQFGNGRQSDNNPTPVETPLTNVAEVAAGGDTTCVRLRTGAVSCFGNGGSGQLGNNARVSSLVPVSVGGNLNNAVKLAGATEHFCALTSVQTVRCWGANLAGGGDDTPTTISLPSNAVDIGAGAEASCALLDNDSLRCWGAGFAGQLGTGAVLNAGSATPLRPLNIP
jgi:cysteine-rich repeat protein